MDRFTDALQRFFGFEDFLDYQREVVEAIASGEDLCVIMPTGAGKSLCYQLPLLLKPGYGIVVSPLIALMKDQIDSLREKGIAAGAINSAVDYSEQRGLLYDTAQGRIKLLYVAPERFGTEGFQRFLAANPPSTLIVDEAHCISQWGHDFRPAYTRLGQVAAQYQIPQVCAFTATATPRVQSDIKTQLGRPEMRFHVAGFKRPNLAFKVVECRGAGTKLDALKRAWDEELRKTDFWSDEERLWIGARTDDGIAVGSILGHVAHDFKDDLEISVLFVKPSLRRCGVASEMLNFLSGEVRKKNFTKIDCRCYLPEDWAPQDTPEPFFDYHGFRRFQLGEKYYFDAQTIFENMPENPVPEFDFVPVANEDEWIKSMDARREATLGELYKQINNDFFHLDSEAVKKMRNQVVLTPQDDIWRIIERASGKVAGWFSCSLHTGHCHIANVCVEPEYRKTRFIWQKVGQIAARQALEKNLDTVSYEVYFWRPGEQRGTRRFGARWGLKEIVPYILFRKEL